MIKNSRLIFYILLLFLGYYGKAQESNYLDEQKRITEDSNYFYNLHGLKSQLPRYIDYYGYRTFFELKVAEVTDTFKRFNYDVNNLFGYCGDVVVGIKNLLQTQIYSTPHVFFLNEPIEKRYVLFYGRGYNMKNSKAKGDSSTKCDLSKQVFNGREMVLKIMQEQFNFEVKESQDSLDYLSLKIIDSTKLMTHKTPIGKYKNGGWAMVDSTNKLFIGTCASLLWIPARLEKEWNIYNDDETNTRGKGIYFEYKIPLDLLDSKEKLPQLIAFLEEKMGLTIVKSKRLETIYTIKFNNMP